MVEIVGRPGERITLEDAQKEFGKDKVYLFAANLELGVERAEILKRVKEQLGEKGWKAGDVRKIKFEIVQGFERLLMLLTMSGAFQNW